MIEDELCPCGHIAEWHGEAGADVAALVGAEAVAGSACFAPVDLDGRLCPCTEWRPRRPASARLRIGNAIARWLS